MTVLHGSQVGATGLVGFAIVTNPPGGVGDFVQEHTAWVKLPERPAAEPYGLPSLLLETRELTGWSQRELAEALATSHTTVRRLESEGRASTRSRDVAVRAAQLHAVIVRLSRAIGSPHDLARVLATPGPQGRSALDLIQEGSWAAAYIAALDAARGPRPEMMGAAAEPYFAGTRELRP